MCDDGPCKDYAGNWDVRAKHPHRVELVIVLNAEDADKALGEVLELFPSGLTIEYIRAGCAE